ncbi:MAG: aminomethyl-transferring glycine dehydrogenase subunit GcvPA [Thermotogaceae bacterium]|nr:aminomethyl-transferring glycine dehydrogenase subunit GcvPA [Thermotogaceae bacterium]
MKRYPYLPHTEEDIREMLKVIGVELIDDLFVDVPKTISPEKLNLPESKDEITVRRIIENLAKKNKFLNEMKVFLGAGIYYRYIPSVVYHMASKPNFVTAYTPYQAEVSQGTLQALFEYQTMICELTGMEVTNASMYDGASALAEAMLMAVRISKKPKVLLSEAVHPEYKRTVETYVKPQGIEVEYFAYDKETGQVDIEDLKKKLDDKVGGVAVAYPNFFGIVEDLKAIKEALPEKVPFVVAADPIALAILEPPAKFGADIVVGEGQALGNFPELGGPGFGFFSTNMKHVRTMPGRLIGKTKDVDGKTGYVMILQTREQHIRRSKATSNICSNHAHSAVMAAIYMATMGKEGLVEVAERSTKAAHYLAKRLEEKGFSLAFKGPFLFEFVFNAGQDYEEKWHKMVEKGILGPLPLSRFYADMDGKALAATTELTTKEDIEALLEAIA